MLTFAADEDRAYLQQLREAGASEYVLKHVSAEELIHAVPTVAAGHFYLDAAVAGDIIAGRTSRLPLPARGVMPYTSVIFPTPVSYLPDRRKFSPVRYIPRD